MKFVSILVIVVLCCVIGMANGGDVPKISCDNCHSEYMTDLAILSSATVDDCKDCHKTGSKMEWNVGSCSDTDGTQTSLISDGDRTWFNNLLLGLGFGKVLAIVGGTFNLVIIIVPICLIILAFVYQGLNNTEKRNKSIQALFILVGLLLVCGVAISLITDLKPDVSLIVI